jgi:acyl-CoA hydrolase
MTRPQTSEPAPRTPSESATEMLELVLPNDTNNLDNLLGGRLMHWIDMAAAAAARRHARRVCVTAAMDSLNFLHPARRGDQIVLKAKVNRAFGSSMEVGVKVFSEDMMTGELFHVASAYLTFVAIGEDGRPKKVRPIRPETEAEQRRFDEAAERRERRLSRRKA